MAKDIKRIAARVWLFCGGLAVAAGVAIVGFSLHSLPAAEERGTPQSGTGWRMTALPNSATLHEVQIKGMGEGAHVQQYSETVEVEYEVDHSRRPLGFVAVFDPKTRFVAWALGVEDAARANWANGLWLVPEVGMLRVNGTALGILVEISRTRTEDFAKWKETLFAQLNATAARSAPAPYDEIRVPLETFLGEDFFSRPGDATPFPPPKTVAVKYSTTGWELELQSSVTPDTAVVYLDPTFKVLRVSRNGKPVYPAPLETPKEK